MYNPDLTSLLVALTTQSWLVGAFYNRSTSSVLTSGLVAQGDRPDGCPPWFVVVLSSADIQVTYNWESC